MIVAVRAREGIDLISRVRERTSFPLSHYLAQDKKMTCCVTHVIEKLCEKVSLPGICTFIIQSPDHEANFNYIIFSVTLPALGGVN